MLSKNTIESFQELVLKQREVEISFDQAEEILRCWVGYFSKLMEIYHREQQKNENKNST